MTAFRRDLNERVRVIIHRVEVTAPDDTDERVVWEVRPEYRRLVELYERLETPVDAISTDELEQVECYIDGIAERISAYADSLNRIDTLEDRITLREATLEALNDDIAQLDEKRKDRLEELSQHRKKVGVLKKAGWARDAGYSRAQDEYQITIPCSTCGSPMVMLPEADMHRCAVQLLTHQEKWHHMECSPMNNPIQ